MSEDTIKSRDAQYAGGDSDTAAAFATSWNTVGEGSVYTREQVLDWLSPLTPSDFTGRSVLELGFGNGSFLYHVGMFAPSRLCGLELGDTLDRTRRNLRHLPRDLVELVRGDLTRVDLGTFDVVYSIGVLHHLKSPSAGFDALLRHTRPGGVFHGWVYAEEGNEVVIGVVDPVRRLTSKLPWWVTKYAVALPLAIPYYLYANGIAKLESVDARTIRAIARRLPLSEYSRWIARRRFSFFHHVAFDQLVTPQTTYIPRSTVEGWLRHEAIEPESVYLICRNGNSWKFGGRRR